VLFRVSSQVGLVRRPHQRTTSGSDSISATRSMSGTRRGRRSTCSPRRSVGRSSAPPPAPSSPRTAPAHIRVVTSSSLTSGVARPSTARCGRAPRPGRSA
jgi:hypothetical protein